MIFKIYLETLTHNKFV